MNDDASPRQPQERGACCPPASRAAGQPLVIAGLSPAAWLLILASVGIGLAIELAFFRAHRHPRGPLRAERRPRGPLRAEDERSP